MPDIPLDQNAGTNTPPVPLGTPSTIASNAPSPNTAEIPTPEITIEKTASNFLGETPKANSGDKNLYDELFHENEQGELILGQKSQKAGLEILVSVLQYIMIFTIILGILATIHVSIRSKESGSFLENYHFLCPYLNYGINLPSEERGCQSASDIKKSYQAKQKGLKENIVGTLVEYIPVKLSSNTIDTSPEKTFIVKSFESKIQVDKIMDAFEKVRTESLSPKGENIKCTGIAINKSYSFSTQCTIYGDAIEDIRSGTGSNSSRINTLQFLENISNTNKSSFVLENPPTALSIEKVPKTEQGSNGFSTRTTVPIQVRYVPFNKKI